VTRIADSDPELVSHVAFHTADPDSESESHVVFRTSDFDPELVLRVASESHVVFRISDFDPELVSHVAFRIADSDPESRVVSESGAGSHVGPVPESVSDADPYAAPRIEALVKVPDFFPFAEA
jgi:hypothetical protein